MNNRVYPTQFQSNITPPTNYPTLDQDSQNPYNYKNLGERFNIYQEYQDLAYFTKKPTDISAVNINQYTRDPTNLPVDQVFRQMYSLGDASNRDILNIHRTPLTNPNLWRDHLPAPAGYYTTREPQQGPCPVSYINVGHESSRIDFHGIQL